MTPPEVLDAIEKTEAAMLEPVRERTLAEKMADFFRGGMPAGEKRAPVTPRTPRLQLSKRVVRYIAEGHIRVREGYDPVTKQVEPITVTNPITMEKEPLRYHVPADTFVRTVVTGFGGEFVGRKKAKRLGIVLSKKERNAAKRAARLEAAPA